MRSRFECKSLRGERGSTLIEVMIALVVLSIGILAIAQVFPSGARTQVSNRMLSTGNYYAQQTLEDLRGLPWTDAALSAGRHPAGVACDTLGATRAWLRYYDVAAMASPLDDLKRVVVNVSWKINGTTKTVVDTTYVRK